jgi:uncharacterized protein
VTLNKRLIELESAGFIQTYIPYGRKIKDHYYRVIDEYCYFYLNWIDPVKKKGMSGSKEYWQTKGKIQASVTWAGYSFENICFKHIDQIQQALDLQSIFCEISSWKFIPPKEKKNWEHKSIYFLIEKMESLLYAKSNIRKICLY